MDNHIEYEIRPQDKFSLNISELWRYRELLFHFVWRDVKVKYKQAALGVLWAILQPLFLMAIFTFIFHRGLQIKGGDGIPYPIFAFTGLLIWQIFSNGLTHSANSMVANATIIKKIYFPRLIIPLSAVITAIVDFFFAFLVFFPLIWFYQVEIYWPELFLYLPLGILLALFCTSGLGLFFSAWNVKYRDFQYVIPFFVQVLFFLSPVLYEPSQFGHSFFAQLLKINPMNGAIHLFRAPFTGIPVDWPLVGWSIISSLSLFLIGLFVFRKMEAYFADLA